MNFDILLRHHIYAGFSLAILAILSYWLFPIDLDRGNPFAFIPYSIWPVICVISLSSIYIRCSSSINNSPLFRFISHFFGIGTFLIVQLAIFFNEFDTYDQFHLRYELLFLCPIFITLLLWTWSYFQLNKKARPKPSF